MNVEDDTEIQQLLEHLEELLIDAPDHIPTSED
jgi:hypothetical protein